MGRALFTNMIRLQSREFEVYIYMVENVGNFSINSELMEVAGRKTCQSRVIMVDPCRKKIVLLSLFFTITLPYFEICSRL